MRTLIIIKIAGVANDALQNDALQASMAPALQQVQLGSSVITKTRKENQKDEQRWKEIESRINSLLFNWNKVRIYQEGLPLAKPELISKIVNESAKQNKNYLLIKKLAAQGARVEGTENSTFLLTEYGFMKKIKESEGTEKEKVEKEYAKIKQDLLARRTSFIADRITITLLEGEIGILFIGSRLAVESKLPADIEIRAI